MADSDDTTLLPGAGRHSTSTKNGDHTVASSGSNVVSSGTRWPCPGPSTIVPTLGIPFREAATRIATLVKEQDGLPDTPEADARSDELTEQWEVLGRAVLGSIPRTPADSVAVIDTALCPAIGPNMDRTATMLFQRVRGVLVQAALEAVQREGDRDGKMTGGTASTIIPALGLTFRDAVDRCLELIAEHDRTPADTAEGEARWDELYREWGGLQDAIFTAIPVTPADGVAIADLLLDDCAGFPISRPRQEKLDALAGLRNLLKRQAPREDEAERGQFLSEVRHWLELEGDSAPEGAAASAALARQIAAYQGEPTVAMAAKALLLWAGHPEAFDTAPGKLHRPPAVAVATNEEGALLFGLVHDALRAVPELRAIMSGPASETESFSAGVAAFDGAAAKALCMPTAPTLAMMEAGAAAGGIDLEQARAIYAAMAVAFAKEAA